MSIELGLANLLAPGIGLPVVEVLKFICMAASEMHESNSLCTRAYDELAFVYEKLRAMEQKGTLPSDAILRKYSRLVGDYSVFLDKHRGKTWLYRVVTYKRVLIRVGDIQADVAGLMRALHLCHMDAVADEIASMKQFRDQQRVFRETQQRVIEARLTDDATVAKEVAHKDQQLEALSVFRHELETANASETASEQQVVRTALNKVIRCSSVQVNSVAEWFLPPHKVEYEPQAFARGSFGSVHHGTMRGDVAVVVKCLTITNMSANERHLRQFRREATLWFGFRHKHVLTMYGACDVSTPPFLVCEYAANSNLCNFLAASERHCAFTFQLLHDAASGLLYLHEKRVVHADLKCDNILVTADGTAKVADFSFSYVRTLSASKMSLADPTSASKAGAVRWRAPECLRGRSPTTRSDVYSFGMCILEAVSQEVPWGYVDDDTVRDLVKSGELPEQPEDMTDRVWTLVQRMCSFEPADRPSLESVVDELGRLASEEAVERGPRSILEVALASSSSFSSYSFDEPVRKNDSVTSSELDKHTSDSVEPVGPVEDTTNSPGKPSNGLNIVDLNANDRGNNADSPTVKRVAYADLSSPLSRSPPPYTSLTLEQAIARDDVKRIEELLSSAYSLEKTIDVWGSTPLIVAAAEGAIGATKHLLSRRANVSATTAANRDFESLADRRCSALHVAAHFGHVHVARELLAAKPDLVKMFTYSRRTALFFAVRSGHAAMVRELLKSGADCKRCAMDTGDTALAVAIDCGQVDCVRVLLECKADLIDYGASRSTALHRAAKVGHVAIISALLKHGARVDERNISGETPFTIAAAHGHLDATRVLLQSKADVHAKSTSGTTALHQAAGCGHDMVIAELLRHGAHVDESSSKGLTPLYWATWKCQLPAARVLLAHKADVNTKGNNGMTALHVAARFGYTEIMSALLAHGARVNERDHFLETPLIEAVKCKQLIAAHLLLKNKAHVEAANSNGMTAMHYAASQGNSEIVKLLLSARATVDGKAVKIAQQKGHKDVIDLLKHRRTR